jgi:hypothetical protein
MRHAVASKVADASGLVRRLGAWMVVGALILNCGRLLLSMPSHDSLLRAGLAVPLCGSVQEPSRPP